MTFLFYLTTTLFILVCVFLILLVLIQKGRGGGLSSAFGGSGGNTAFGSKTGDVLTWATSIVFGIFLLLAVALNLIADKRNIQQAQADELRMKQNQEAPLKMPTLPRESLPGEVPSTTLPPNTVPPAPPTTQP